MTREEWDKLTPDGQWNNFIKAGNLAFEAVAGWGNQIVSSWKPPVDDKGNPPPPYLYGDMFPHWEDGQWWVCHDSLIQHRKKKEAESK